MQSCDFCLHLHKSGYCPKASGVVPVDFLSSENSCPDYLEPKTDADALKLLYKDLKKGAPWIATDILEGVLSVDKEHFDRCVQDLSLCQDKITQFIVKRVLLKSPM